MFGHKRLNGIFNLIVLIFKSIVVLFKGLKYILFHMSIGYVVIYNPKYLSKKVCIF